MDTKQLIYVVLLILAGIAVAGPCGGIYAQVNPQPAMTTAGNSSGGESKEQGPADRMAVKPPATSNSKFDVKPSGAQAEAGEWFEKGVLFSVYGNYNAAVRAFKKAADLVPDWSEAYFQLGVSYGEAGRFEDAVSSIDKAIELDGSKGIYYYGRGRVYLMAGDKAKAMEDFSKAADMRDEDAKRYLKKQRS